MIELQKHTGKLKVENYGLMEWATDVQAAVKQGYEIDTSNEGYPQNFGALYTCLMVESVSNPLQEEVEYLRKELKQLQASTVNLLPQTEHLVGEDQLVYPGGNKEPVVHAPVNEATEQQDTKATELPDEDQPVRRGPKPKNK